MWIARIKNLKTIRGVTYNDIANACGVSKTKVCNWFNGVTMPDPEYIDIMHDKFFGGMYAADYLESLFSYAYEEKHNVDGQIGICEVNEEQKETKEYLTIESMVGIFYCQMPWKALRLIIDKFDDYLSHNNGGVNASSLTNDDWDKILYGLWPIASYKTYYNRALLTLYNLGYYKFEEATND